MPGPLIHCLDYAFHAVWLARRLLKVACGQRFHMDLACSVVTVDPFNDMQFVPFNSGSQVHSTAGHR